LRKIIKLNLNLNIQVEKLALIYYNARTFSNSGNEI
jgi:hypothetical protein